jgi:bla regulator protein BlaR1
MEDLMRMAASNAVAAVALGAAVAALAPALARRPAVMHALWLLVLLKLVTPPLFEIPVGVPGLEEAAVVVEPTVPPEEVDLQDMEWAWVDLPEATTIVPTPDASAVDEARPWPIELATACRVLGGVWLAGALATAVLAGSRILRFQRSLRDASPAGLAVEGEVAALAADMGLRRPPRVDFIDARVTPMLWGMGWRPRLILPRMLWKDLDARRRTLLLAHELAHLRRGDHLWRFLELAATVLYWWHPVVWWVRKALRDAEEQCCDAWVVWMFPDDARAYAETLLDTVDFLNPGSEPAPLLASGFGKVRHLRRRLTMVMKGTTPKTMGLKGSLGALALAGVLLPIGPTWAQKASEAESLVSVRITDDPFGGSVIVADKVEREGDVLTFHASADDKSTTIHRGDEEGKREAEGEKDKAEVRKETRLEFRGAPDQGRVIGLRRAVEELKGRIKDLESREVKDEGVESQIKAHQTALEALEKMAEHGPSTIDFRGRTPDDALIRVPDPFAARSKPVDPNVAAAWERVQELKKELAEKQKDLSRTARMLSAAQNELGKLQAAGAQARAAEAHRIQRGAPPRIAEGRAIIRVPDRSEDKARIDALEQKLDRVLKQLERLNKPEPEDKEKGEDEGKD